MAKLSRTRGIYAVMLSYVGYSLFTLLAEPSGSADLRAASEIISKLLDLSKVPKVERVLCWCES